MAVTWSAGIFGLLRAWADGTSFQVDKITRTHEYLTEGYLGSYAVEQEKIESYECNGSNWGPNVLARAFDRNFDTFWETNKINGANFTNTVTANGQRFSCQPTDMELLVYYTTTTFSIPAQTTPQKIIVMCPE